MKVLNRNSQNSNQYQCCLHVISHCVCVTATFARIGTPILVIPIIPCLFVFQIEVWYLVDFCIKALLMKGQCTPFSWFLFHALVLLPEWIFTVFLNWFIMLLVEN